MKPGPFGPLLIFSTAVPVRTVTPSLAKISPISAEVAGSAAGGNRGAASITVTAAPSRPNAWARSQPTAPPPAPPGWPGARPARRRSRSSGTAARPGRAAAAPRGGNRWPARTPGPQHAAVHRELPPRRERRAAAHHFDAVTPEHVRRLGRGDRRHRGAHRGHRLVEGRAPGRRLDQRLGRHAAGERGLPAGLASETSSVRARAERAPARLTSRTKPSSSGDARRRPLSWVSTSRNPGVNTHDVELRARAAPHVTLLTTTVIADPLSGRETGFVPSPRRELPRGSRGRSPSARCKRRLGAVARTAAEVSVSAETLRAIACGVECPGHEKVRSRRTAAISRA